MRGGGGIDRARTFSGGDLVGDGGQVLRQMVVQFGGETCALICLHLRFRLRDLAAVHFASAPFGEDAERSVPDENRHEQQQEIAQLQAAPLEELSTEQQLYRRICMLMDKQKPYTDETLNRDALAQMLGTNAKYVEQAIRQCSKGETVSDYINRYRLEHVARLLKNTNHPIAVIGEISGIPSRATLGRLFRIAYGMTPSEYRSTTPKY